MRSGSSRALPSELGASIDQQTATCRDCGEGPQPNDTYDAGEISGGDTRGGSGWVDADGSDDGGAPATSSAVSSSVSSSITSPASNGADPVRRTRKRGRSLRKNVLLRTRGVLMSNLTTNGLGIITPGMVLGAEHHSHTHAANNSNLLPPSPSIVTTNRADDEADHSSTSSITSTSLSLPTKPNEVINNGYSTPSPSPSFPASFIDLPWPPLAPRDSIDPLADTVWWGYFILLSTWLIFVIGMGSVLGVWGWAWDVPSDHPIPIPSFLRNDGNGILGGEEEDEFPIQGYYPALMILTSVVAWVWVIVAWVGMKYFKHAKIQPQSDDT